MSDIWSERLFEASYGGVALHIFSTSDEGSRSVPIHEYPHVDGGNTEDMGAVPRTTECTLVFMGDDHLERFQAFKDLVDSGEAHTFVHPLTGAYEARVPRFTYSIDSENRDYVSVEATFLEATTEVAVFDLGDGRGLFAQADAVETAEVALDAELANAGLTSTVGSEASATARRWVDSPNVTRGTVEVDLASLSAKVDQDITTMELFEDVALYPLHLAYMDLLRSLRRVADSLIRQTPKVSTLTLTEPTPLLLIAQRLYGGARAPDMFARLLQLNKLKTPSLVPPGTTLTIEAV